MDTGRAKSHEDAMRILSQFGIQIEVGPEAEHSRDHQIAVLTLVNAARRTFLGGIRVRGVKPGRLLVPIADTKCFAAAVQTLGAQIVEHPNKDWPLALIGSVSEIALGKPSWRLTWEGWRGGVLPARQEISKLNDHALCALAPAVSAAVCASEAFSFFAGDHPMAGRRAAGISLWNPGKNWLTVDASERQVSLLPSRLWMIGLGNLGQAFLWLLAALPYADRADVELVLQDFDLVASSNDSTSMLTQPPLIGQMKTRAISHWLEERDFRTVIEERRFGPWIQRNNFEPGAAICGVDNPDARRYLEDAGFGLVIEAGLGYGPQAFRNFSLHTFPSAFKAKKLWSHDDEKPVDKTMPAYSPSKHPELDECGLAQLASRSVGVPFVSLTAAGFVMAEILRRLNGGVALELVSGSMSCLDDIEVAHSVETPYQWGHAAAEVCVETF